MFNKLRLIDNNTDRYIDALYAVLMMSNETQFFPELYEIFGRNRVLQFLHIFSGQKIQVPTIEYLEQKIKEVQIWMEFKKNPSNRLSIINSYGVSDSDIDSIVRSVDRKIEELGITVDLK